MNTTTIKHATLIAFAKHANASVAAGRPVEIPEAVETSSPKWRTEFRKFAAFQAALIASDDSAIVAANKNKIFSRKGNVKLPFLSFSSMPLLDCPGMGQCKDFCYSKKGWRNVSPYFRQLRNSLLMRFRFDVITSEFARLLKLPAYALQTRINFRLFVDGDFDSVNTLSQWMTLIANYPKVSAYGYSKSWELFATYDHMIGGEWPTNYKVNISSGSRYHRDSGIARAMRNLSCVRGEFIAIGSKDGAAYGSRDYYRKARSAAKAQGIDRPFVCPGQCGSCTGSGHVCGGGVLPAGTPVVILTH